MMKPLVELTTRELGLKLSPPTMNAEVRPMPDSPQNDLVSVRSPGEFHKPGKPALV
jgi:hypothetical protein